MNTIKKGKCLNFGNCPKADRNEIIELDVTEDFICPECNSDLQEMVQRKKSKLPWIILVLLLLGGGAAAYFLLVDKKTDLPPESSITQPISDTVDDFDNEKITKDETIPTTTPEEIKETPVEKAPATKPTTTPSTPSSGTGTIAVSGGNYTGELKNGKPHGMGTLKYTTRTLISKRDAKGRYAEVGEYITGEFYEGELVNGKLFDKNGDQREALNIGRPH